MERSRALEGAVARPAERAGFSAWSRTFDSLRERNYRLYWTAMLVSFFGLQMQAIAQSWLVYDMTGSTLALGWVNFGSGLPIVIFSVVGGVAADRMSKRHLLMGSQAGIGLLAVAVGMLVLMDVIQLWHVVASAFGIGVISAFNMPARQSIVNEIVGRERLMNALALNSSSMNLSRVAAPALGGVLIGAIGVANLYFAKAVAYAIFIIAMSVLVLPHRPPARANSSAVEEMKVGLRYVRGEPIMMTLVLMGLISVLFGASYQMLMPAFAKDVLHRGASGLGLLMGAVGVGALIGALTVAYLGDFQRKGLLLIAEGAGFGLVLLAFAGVSWLGLFHVTLGVLVLVGFFSTGFMAINNTLLQMLATDEMRGRVMGVYMTTFGLQSVAVLPLGAAADQIGAPAAVAIFAGLFLLALALIVARRREVATLS